MSEKEKGTITSKHLIYGSIIVLVIWILSGLTIHLLVKERGTFGDMFGAINSLFSGFALFGIILSIYLQRQELGLQRLEMKETRDEFKQSRLTNILFKKVEFINNEVAKAKFLNYSEKWSDVLAKYTIENFDVPIEEFKDALNNEKYLFENKGEKIKRNDKLMKINETNLFNLISLVDRDLSSTLQILNFAKLNSNAIDELTFVYSESINPNFKQLIFDLRSIKKRKEIEIASNSQTDYNLINFLTNIENLYQFFFSEYEKNKKTSSIYRYI